MLGLEETDQKFKTIGSAAPNMLKDFGSAVCRGCWATTCRLQLLGNQ